MRVRPLLSSDIPIIRAMYESSGLCYDLPELDGPRMECVLVVEDEKGSPLMACGAEKILQLYLWATPFEPAAKLHAIRLLHEVMPALLLEKGYTEVDAFIPPDLERSFGKRLSTMFNWTKNSWASYNRKLKRSSQNG